MLVRRQTERALVDLGDFTQTCLEFLSGFVLDASVLDVDRDVMPAVLTDGPPEMIDIAFKGIRTGWGELEPKAVFHISFKVVEAHSIDRIFQASVLRQGQYPWFVNTMIVFTFRLLEISDERMLEKHDNSLDAVPIVSLSQHNLLCYEWSLLNGTKPNDISNARVRLFVTVGHTHATAHCDIKTFQFAIFVDDSDEAEVIGKNVDIVVRRDSDRNFELDGTQSVANPNH